MPALTMYAIRKMGASPGLSGVDDTPLPAVGDTDVRIAVTLAGICGTDRHIYLWDEWSQGRLRPPFTVGHEFVGEVVEIGKEVHTVTVGTRVSAEAHIGCRVCRLCRSGNSHICERVEGIGVQRDGAFAQFVVLPQENIWPLAEHIPDHVAAIMDPFGNAMHTVTAADVSGRTVLITGVGVIGLMAVAIARQLGASQIIATDTEPRHLKRAGDFGADELLRADDLGWTRRVRDLTGGEGVEVWLEMSGAAQALQTGFDALGNGGSVALLGLPRRSVELDVANDVILKGAELRGISGRRMFETWYQMERFLARPENVDIVGSLVTHRFSARRFDKAFAVLESGEAIKVLLEFEGV